MENDRNGTTVVNDGQKNEVLDLFQKCFQFMWYKELNKDLEMGTVKRVTMKLGETVFPIAGARPLIRRDSKLMDGGLGATPGTICGLDYMRDPKLNKGSSFTIEERQTLGIHGLLPPR